MTDIKEIEDKLSAMSKLNIVKSVHPTIDVIDDRSVLGFTIPTSKDGKKNDELLLITEKNESDFSIEYGSSPIEISGNQYFIDSTGFPPELENKWKVEDLKAFITEPSCDVNILKEIESILKEYIHFQNEDDSTLISAWIIMTYFSPIFPALPFLFVYGPKESGKSQLLHLLSLLSFNGEKLNRISEAALGSLVAGQRSTLCIDQAEGIQKGIIGLLTDSYKQKGGTRFIAKSKNSFSRYNMFGPKAFGSFKPLNYDLKDRCCQINMQKANRRMPDILGSDQRWIDLRGKCYRFFLMKRREVKAFFDLSESDGSRISELKRPIEAILKASSCEDDIIEKVKEAFIDGTEKTKAEVPLSVSAIIQIVFEKMEGKDELEMTASDIHEGIKELLENFEIPEKQEIGSLISQFSLADSKKRKTRKKLMHYIFKRQNIKRFNDQYDTLLCEEKL